MIDCQINPKYKSLEKAILDIPRRFDQEGEVIDDKRNVIKILDVEGERFNVKSFKKPNIVNQFAYAYVRKGKAQRSFEYANTLLERGVDTPEPIAYIVYRNVFGVTRSFYISRQEEYDYTFRDLRVKRPADLESILREFTRFTYHFHSQSIYFIDHSPGNVDPKGRKSISFYVGRLESNQVYDDPPVGGLEEFLPLECNR